MKSSLLQSLFDDEERRPLTISELNAQVKDELNRRFSSVWIEGEIMDFYDADSGHWYFTLHDFDSQIKAACYKGANWKIRFKPFDGLKVRVRGRLSIYEPRGEYQILVESLEAVGEGALKIAFEQIKAKLEKEKLFDDAFKRSLPYFPKRIGVVTSLNGAAFHDIMSVIKRRTKTVSIILIPARVQGEDAPEEIREAIKHANGFNSRLNEKEKIEVLIVGRGGGSAEDLSAFNEEHLARAIFASEIPVISAVGHETDYTIADLVADARAATPSAAAEIIAEKECEAEALIDRQKQALFSLVDYKILQAHNQIQALSLSTSFNEFPQKVKGWRYEVEDLGEKIADLIKDNLKKQAQLFDQLTKRLSPIKLASNLGKRKTLLAVLSQRNSAAVRDTLNSNDEKLNIGMASLDALSPLSILNRGFSVTQNEKGEILRNTKSVKIEDKLKIRLANGKLEAVVEKKID